MSIEKLHPTFTLTEERIAQLKVIVPEAFTDGKINWDTLKSALAANLEDDDDNAEHYGLNWPGKRKARALAVQAPRGSLYQALGEGVDEKNTGNIFIEGDNLEVLKLLQKSYTGRIKMIYIDPPYNTGNDFVYTDDFKEPIESYLKSIGDMGEDGTVLTTNTKTDGRFHSKWLSMMYPRLLLARNLLCDDGMIFISIDDGEITNLKQIMNEVYGEENCIATLIWKSRQIVDSRAQNGVSKDHEYVVIYGKSPSAGLRGKLSDISKYSNPDNDKRGPWMSNNMLGLANKAQRPNLHYVIVDPKTGRKYAPPSESGWRYSKERMDVNIKEGRVIFPAKPDGRPREKIYLSELDSKYTGFSSLISFDIGYTMNGTRELKDLLGGSYFPFPKPVSLVKNLIEQGIIEDEGIVLDFFAGSGTTAQAVIEFNKQFNKHLNYLLIQVPEKITDNSDALKAGYKSVTDILKDRLKLVSKNEKEVHAKQLSLDSKKGVLDKGFSVLKLSRSNFKAWQEYTGTNVQEIETLFDKMDTPLIDGWKKKDLLVEVLLMEGFPLNSKVEKNEDFKKNDVFLIGCSVFPNRLLVCLDDKIYADTIKSLTLEKDDTFVCLDTAITDEAKVTLSDKGCLKVI